MQPSTSIRAKSKGNYPVNLEKLPSPTTHRTQSPIPAGQNAKRHFVLRFVQNEAG
jgi:hypothetical protein